VRENAGLPFAPLVRRGTQVHHWFFIILAVLSQAPAIAADRNARTNPNTAAPTKTQAELNQEAGIRNAERAERNRDRLNAISAAKSQFFQNFVSTELPRAMTEVTAADAIRTEQLRTLVQTNFKIRKFGDKPEFAATPADMGTFETLEAGLGAASSVSQTGISIAQGLKNITTPQDGGPAPTTLTATLPEGFPAIGLPFEPIGFKMINNAFRIDEKTTDPNVSKEAGTNTLIGAIAKAFSPIVIQGADLAIAREMVIGRELPKDPPVTPAATGTETVEEQHNRAVAALAAPEQPARRLGVQDFILSEGESAKLFTDLGSQLKAARDNFDKQESEAKGGGGEETPQQADAGGGAPAGGAPGGGNQSPSNAGKAPGLSGGPAALSFGSVGGQAVNDIAAGFGGLGSYLSSKIAPFLDKDPHPVSGTAVGPKFNNQGGPGGPVETVSAKTGNPVGSSSPGTGLSGGAPGAAPAEPPPANSGSPSIAGGGGGGGGGDGFPQGVNGGDYDGPSGARSNPSQVVEYASGGTVDGGEQPSINKAGSGGDFMTGATQLLSQLLPSRAVNALANMQAGLVQARVGKFSKSHCGDPKFQDLCLAGKVRPSTPSRSPASTTPASLAGPKEIRS